MFGIDGADAQVLEQLMVMGRLPNFQRLKEKGGYGRLATTNPAQSPVSWAAFSTGSNPGKTGIYDFLRRDPTIPGKIEISIAEKRWTGDGLPSATMRSLGPWGLGAVVGLVVYGLVLLVLRLAGVSPTTRRRISAVAGVLAAFAAGAVAMKVVRMLPTKRPMAVNQRQGTPVWNLLGDAGVDSVVLEAPVTFPADRAKNLRLLSGLGVPDVQGTWGFYTVFTDDPKMVVNAETGGFVDTLDFSAGPVAYTRVYGPENISFSDEEKETISRAIREARLVFDARSGVPSARRVEERALKHAELARNTSCLLEVKRDPASKSVVLRIGAGGPRPVLDIPRPSARDSVVALPPVSHPLIRWSDPVLLEEGVWSGPVIMEFDVNAVLGSIKGVSRFRLESAGGPGREFRLVMEPVNMDPSEPPPFVELSHPLTFSVELAKKIGVYRTIGWPCLTNPVKDELLTDDAFMDHIRELTEERKAKLKAAMDDPDWRFLFALFSEVDRVQHVMWRHTDSQSPSYDAEKAEKYGGCIAETYVAMDEVLGGIMDSCGDDTAVIVMSDHGFAPFRRGVNLNTFLLEQGFQTNKGTGGGTGENRSVGELFSATNFFERIDWEKTEAYALGLGQIYINLQGREKEGSVTQAQYTAVCQKIRAALLALRDGDRKVVREVYLGTDIFKGPTTLKYAPDLVVGFERGYRVSWQTSLGGGGPAVIEDNRLPWSGDHCSVDPSLVPGILFSSVPLEFENASVMDVAPTILELFGIEQPPEWDGHSLLKAK